MKWLLYMKKLTDICVFYSSCTKLLGRHFLRFKEKFERNYSGYFYILEAKGPFEFLSPEII